MPPAVTESQPDYALTCEYKQQGNKITYKRTISFDNGIVKKSEMKEFIAFLKKMKNAYDDQLILAKK